MKKKFPLWMKVKFIIYWFKEFKGTGTIVTCGKCKSTKVTFQEGHQEGNIYKSKYICENVVQLLNA